MHVGGDHNILLLSSITAACYKLVKAQQCANTHNLKIASLHPRYPKHSDDNAPINDAPKLWTLTILAIIDNGSRGWVGIIDGR